MSKPATAYRAYKLKNMRELITPEGVDLQVELADLGARAGAFLIDIMIMFVLLILMTWAVIATGIDDEGDFGLIIWILFFFFLRSFYFMFFEMGPKAATPGKRICKIRVAARGKARLTANAVFARNALREIEFFLPLSFLGANISSVDGWISTFGLIWGCIFLFFPMFNRDRLRAGDLIAGTWVVTAPRPMLASDLAEASVDAPQGQFAFTSEQINAYGVHELHVLEDVIRRNEAKILADVAPRIRKKIGWEKTIGEQDLAFLKAYYAALRGRLETKLMFGVRRRDKHDIR
ncbi:MAG: RDD family protein [Alphaproteobacteria bacterium]